MIAIYDNSHLLHDPEYEIYDGAKINYPEVPDRIETIKNSLTQVDGVEFISPKSFDDKLVFELHSKQYVSYLKDTTKQIAPNRDLYPSNFIHDTYAPLTQGTFTAARKAVDTALRGAELVAQGDSLVYSLCRPPGHHAGGNYMGGYCYFNNAAAAANFLSKHGKVAILDIDYHHGNGTQELFYDRDDVLYVSVHADPSLNYPYSHGFEHERGRGKGLGYNQNFIVDKNCGTKPYMATFHQALSKINEFNADFLVVSLGFDGYRDDPIAGFNLSSEDYASIAKYIADVDSPTLLVQEGGYCVEALGELARVFTKNMMQHKNS